MRRFVAVVLLTGLVFVGMIGLGAGTAMAVPLHEHYIVTPVSTVEIAGGMCNNPAVFADGGNAHHAFDHFHGWIHAGPVPTTVIASACS